MSEEWSDWIHGNIPPPVGAYVQMDVSDVKGRGDITHEAIVLGFEGEGILLSPEIPIARQWEVIRYRIRRPRALRELIDMVENLPAPVSPEGVEA